MPNNSKPHVWRGKEMTRKEIAELEYVTLDTVTRWLREGRTKPPTGKLYDFDGERMTAQQIAIRYGVTSTRVYQWLSAGCTEAPEGRHKQKYLWDGEMLEVEEIARRVGTTRANARNYLSKHNRKWTTDEVREMRLRWHTGQPCEWNGITYPSITAGAKALGITAHALKRRLHQGWRCDADIVPAEVVWKEIATQHPKPPIVFSGKTFTSYKEMAEHYGVSEATARRYVKIQRRQKVVVEKVEKA